MRDRKRELDPVAGEVLLIDKPLNWTSFDVVNKIRGMLRKAYGLKKLKVGHAGTLDPLATGLLILCTGRMTKQIEEYKGMDKVYTGTIRLGATTPSLDTETEEIEQFPTDHLDKERILEVMGCFEGELSQVPPAYSAKRIKGVRAYEKARHEQPAMPDPVTVRVESFELTGLELPYLHFRITCGAGTYIRSLARDLGKALENAGHLYRLRRTRIGSHRVEDADRIEAFEHLLGPNG